MTTWTVNGWTYWHFPHNVVGEPTAVPEVTWGVASFDNGRRDDCYLTDLGDAQ